MPSKSTPFPSVAPLRVGVVGAGAMGCHHLRAIGRLPECARVIAVVDPSESARESAKEIAPEAQLFSGVERMLEEGKVDVVHVCTAPERHETMAVRALEYGCHIYVEKPFAPDVPAAERILSLARERDLRACAGHQLLFEPPTRMALELLPAIREVVHLESYFSFRPVRTSRGGRGAMPADAQLLDILPHPVYLLLRFLEEAVPGAETELVSLEAGPAGTIHALVRRGGVSSDLTVTLEGRPVESYMRIVGRNGSLHADYVRGTVQRLIGPGTSGIDKVLNPLRLSRQLAAGTVRAVGARLLSRQRSYPGLVEIFRAFYSAVQEGGEGPTPPRSIVDTVHISERVAAELKSLKAPATVSTRVASRGLRAAPRGLREARTPARAAASVDGYAGGFGSEDGDGFGGENGDRYGEGSGGGYGDDPADSFEVPADFEVEEGGAPGGAAAPTTSADGAPGPGAEVTERRSAGENPRVLVTGGTGFLGREVARLLLESGAETTVLARREPVSWERMEGVEYRVADLGEGVSKELLRGFDTLIHCAAETVGGWDAHRRNSVDATRNLLVACADAGVAQIIHVSSTAVLAPPGGRDPVGEDSPLHQDPRAAGPYVWGKLESERLARALGEELSLAVRVVRPPALVDYRRFEAPGKLGRTVGNLAVAVGRPREELAVADVESVASTIAWMAWHFDDAPDVLNVLPSTIPSRRELVDRLRDTNPDLRVVWLPRALLHPLSWVALGAQRVLRPGRTPISVARVFAPQRYDNARSAALEPAVESFFRGAGGDRGRMRDERRAGVPPAGSSSGGAGGATPH